MINKAKKAEIIGKHQKHPKDTGHSAVQVALLTERIRQVSEHLKGNKKDYTSQVGLLKMVGDRKRHLTFIKRADQGEYERLIKTLEIRK